MTTHYPFLPKMRLEGEDVGTELHAEMVKIAKYYNLDTSKMSARIELLPNPETDGETHYVSAEVTCH